MQSKLKAFTLVELVIVVGIIGVVYALALKSFSLNKEEKLALSLENLPFYLKQNYGSSKAKVTFRCFDRCKQCAVFVDNEIHEEFHNVFSENAEVKVSRIINQMGEKLEFSRTKIGETLHKTCFSYNLYPNLSLDEIMLEYNDKVYFYSNLADYARIFEDESELMAYLDEQKSLAMEN